MISNCYKHLTIVRTAGSVLNIETYNCQELGLSKALVRKGWSVSIILAGNKKEKKEIDVDGKKINVYYVTYKSFTQALTIFDDLFLILNQINPTHIQIHEFGMWMSYMVVRWAKSRNIPVYLIQGAYQTTCKPFFKQLEVLFNITFGKYLLRKVTGIGCKSKMAREYIAKYCDRNIWMTPVGLDIERFSVEEKIDWRKKLGFEKKHILTYVGILENRRNPLFLLQIINMLPDDFILLFAGDGPQNDEVRRQIMEQRLENRCIMLGKLKQEQLPSLYKATDLFLLASDYEIYGMVLLEALYYGVPVVTTRTAGSDMLIQQNKNGVILEKNSNLWVKEIIKLVNDNSNLTLMKSFASNDIVHHYIWERAVENFINLYLHKL